MKSQKGYIVDITHKTFNEKTFIQIFGRLENKKSFALVKEITPYFFIEESNLSKIKKLLKNYKIEKTNLTNFLGNSVLKISANNQPDLTKL